MKSSVIARSLLLVTVVCSSLVFGQKAIGGPAGAPPPPPPPPPRAAGNVIAGYTFGDDNVKNGEDLAEAVVAKLAASAKYSNTGRGSRAFFREVEKLEAKSERRGKLPEDRDFCRIGGDFGVNYLCIIDIEKTGRGASVWARILDLSNCTVVANGEFVGLVRNTAEIEKAANELSGKLLQRQIFKRSIAAALAPPPPPPPPAPRGNAIAGYVFGADDARNGEELASQVVAKLADLRKYSQPRRNSREFFAEVAKMEEKTNSRGRLLQDKDFCRIGNDFGVEYLCIIDIEKAGRGASIWARILDLDNCTIIATGENKALIRNTAEINAVADDLVRQLSERKIGRRSIQR